MVEARALLEVPWQGRGEMPRALGVAFDYGLMGLSGEDWERVRVGAGGGGYGCGHALGW